MRQQTLFFGSFLFATGALGCDPERVATVIDPIFGEACRHVECPESAQCVADSDGLTSCACDVGYQGAACDRCESGFHRDARQRCLPDVRCAEQDPCGDHGSCNDDDGVIECTCQAPYAGPRCTLCAPPAMADGMGACVTPLDAGVADATAVGDADVAMDAAPDAAESDAASIDAAAPDAASPDASADASMPDAAMPDAAPPDAATCYLAEVRESFETQAGFPSQLNTCTSIAKLTVPGVELVSRQGDGTVQRCAPSTLNGMTTRFVELAASPTRAAELRFEQPIVSLQLRYAVTISSLSLDVLADGRQVSTMTLAPNGSAQLSLTLDPPARVIALRSRTPYIQTPSIDDLFFQVRQCN